MVKRRRNNSQLMFKGMRKTGVGLAKSYKNGEYNTLNLSNEDWPIVSFFSFFKHPHSLEHYIFSIFNTSLAPFSAISTRHPFTH
jgi:ferredoxin-NADP reductase